MSRPLRTEGTETQPHFPLRMVGGRTSPPRPRPCLGVQSGSPTLESSRRSSQTFVVLPLTRPLQVECGYF